MYSIQAEIEQVSQTYEVFQEISQTWSVRHKGIGCAIPFSVSKVSDPFRNERSSPKYIYFEAWMRVTRTVRRRLWNIAKAKQSEVKVTATVTKNSIYEEYRHNVMKYYDDMIYPPMVATCTGYLSPIKGYKADLMIVDDVINETPKKGSNTMFYNLADGEQRSYLASRLDEATSDFDRDLRSKYNMDPKKPKTVKEVIDRIKAGDITVSDDDLKKDVYAPSRAFDYISWFSPKAPKDETGYLAASDKLSTAAQEARDTIAVLPLADGLKALKDFEAKSFQ